MTSITETAEMKRRDTRREKEFKLHILGEIEMKTQREAWII